MDDADRRATMVQRDIAGRGIQDARLIAAMAEVPREEFVPKAQRRHAYEDRALPIGHDQTISQPYVVAVMLQALALQPTDHLLEVGSGSGYAAAVASRMCARVTGIERVAALAAESMARLTALAYDNVSIVAGDGTVGWSDGAPYDAILVSAAGPKVPTALTEQLVDGGRLVIPVGASRWTQVLVRIERTGDQLRRTNLGGVAFVPLIGVSGWKP